GRDPPGDPRRATVPPDRPRADPNRLRRRSRRLRPGHRDGPLHVRRRPDPGRRCRSCPGQWHARAGERRADRCHPRPSLAAGVSSRSLQPNRPGRGGGHSESARAAWRLRPGGGGGTSIWVGIVGAGRPARRGTPVTTGSESSIESLDHPVDNAPVRTLQHKNLTIEGYSRAAVQSYWRVPELKLGFDLGAQPWSFMTTPTWFVTHTHLDHVAALPVLVARRR